MHGAEHKGSIAALQTGGFRRRRHQILLVRSARSGFATSIATLAGGATFAQVLALLAAPVLTRLYPPEAFGVAAVFASTAVLLTVVACFRYELAIMLPADDDEAAGVFVLCLLSAALTGALTLVAVLLGRHWVARSLNVPELDRYLLLVPVAVVAGGVWVAFSYWSSRTKRFRQLTVAQMTSSTTSVGSQLGAGLAGFTSAGSLIGGSLFGSFLSTVVLGGQILARERLLLRRGMRFHSMLHAARRYRDFPLITTWAGLLNNASWQLPAFMLAAFFSPVVVGFYALGNRLIRLPMQVVGNAISTVFFQRGAEGHRKGDLPEVTAQLFSYLLKIGVIPTLFLTFMGRDLFVVCFGSNWAEAGVYTQLLGPWALLYFASSPLSRVFNITEQQRKILQLQTMIFTSRCAALLIGGWSGNARVTIALFGVSGILAYGYLLVEIAGAVRIRLRTVLKICRDRMTEAVPVGGWLLLVSILDLPVLQAVLLAAIGSGIFFAILLMRDQRIGSFVRHSLARHQGH